LRKQLHRRTTHTAARTGDQNGFHQNVSSQK
jgi:hypothetical protein